jgi:hypothetical protein
MQTWNMERHLVTRRDPGMETCSFSSLLLLVYEYAVCIRRYQPVYLFVL